MHRRLRRRQCLRCHRLRSALPYSTSVGKAAATKNQAADGPFASGITLRATQQPSTRERDSVTGRMSLAPAYIAIAAVLLYVLGVVASVGQIRASHLDETQAFSLIPLERHLRIGVATLLSESVLTILAVATLAIGSVWFSMYLAARASSETESARPKADGSRAEVGTWEKLYRALLVGVLVFCSLNLPWPVAPVIVASVALTVMMVRMAGQHPAARVMITYACSVLLLAVVVAAADAFLAGDPLPRATVTTGKAPITGPLIAINDGVVYLGPRRKGDLYQSVPTSEVVRMDVQRRRRPDERSVIQMLGW